MCCLQPEGNKQQTMYRYCVDNAVTYTSEDFVLFRESPFAAWMERLTLENPDHGIPPDIDSKPPANPMQRQDDLADTLREEEKDVCLVDWDAAEPDRRSATLGAMRRGVDFIVNGQLALGPLSDSANLLMRTSGYSELGNYLYIPCDTQVKTTLNSAFRLCFLADLLHSLQGQLPPQMLIIRGDSDLLPLQTEDHIYHYRAVKHRFMETMRTFRKHRMPDPVDSSHFGRWSDCANEVMKQRAIRGEDGQVPPVREIEYPLPRVAEAGVQGAAANQASRIGTVGTATSIRPGLQVSGTLADQAKLLHPQSCEVGSQTSGYTADPVSTGPSQRRQSTSAADAALENLEFIGSGLRAPTIGGFRSNAAGPEPTQRPESEPGPVPEPEVSAPVMAEPDPVPEPEVSPPVMAEPEPVPEPEFSPPVMAEPERVLNPKVSAPMMAGSEPVPESELSPPLVAELTSESQDMLEPVTDVAHEVIEAKPAWPVRMAPAIVDSSGSKPHPLDSSGYFAVVETVVDRDDITPIAAPPPGLNTDNAEFEVDCIDDSDYRLPADFPPFGSTEGEASAPFAAEPPLTTRPFSSSLNTAGDLEE